MTASHTASVIFEIVALDRSTPSVLRRWWEMSRTVIPPAYRLTIIASSPSILRWPLRTRRGVKLPARSLGTSISKDPTSESMVLEVVPPAGVATSHARGLALLIAQVLIHLGAQAGLQGLLEQCGQ